MDRRGLLLSAAFMGWLSGCSVGPVAVDHTSAPAIAVVTAAELFPLGEQQRPAVVTDRGVAHAVKDRTERLADTRRVVYRRVVNGFWEVDLVAQPDGAVSAVREVELDQARRIEYDPPLPIVPGILRSDEPIEATSQVRLYNHDSGALEAEGEVTAVYTLLGRAGEGAKFPDAVVIRTDRKYHLPLVVVDMKLTGTYQPGEGPVAGRVVRTVKLLGLLPVVHVQTIEVAE